MLAAEALDEVAQMLDDPQLVHATALAALRHLNRAHQYVALRYALLRQTRSVQLHPSQALYLLPSVFPQFVRLLRADLQGVGPLWVVPMEVLRFGDPRWSVRPATPTHPPQWVYQGGLSFVGVYPVPVAHATMSLIAAVAPNDLLQPGQALEVPDAYTANVIEVCAGFLMLSAEKAYTQGLAHVRRGLGLSTPGS